MAYKKSFVDIDNRRVSASKIKLAGIELEGAWKAVPEGVKLVDSITPGWNELGRDGSLSKSVDGITPSFRDRLDRTIYPYVGELPSHPMETSEIGKWLADRYPDEVGPECGLHIHISLKNPLVYMWLMDDEAYPATVVEYIKRWAEKEKLPKTDPIWNRLAGKCAHCQHEHWPKEQSTTLHKDYNKERKGNRYTAIAFHYLRDGLGTIECRLGSMPKTADQAHRYVEEFLSITNRYLVATAKREVRQVATVVDDQPGYELTLQHAV